MKKESIKLRAAQRQSIERILSKGKALAWTLKHAQVLLKVDRGPQGPGWSTSQVVEAYGVSRSTVERICRLFREQGLDAALFRRPQPPRPQKRKLDGEAEAHLERAGGLLLHLHGDDHPVVGAAGLVRHLHRLEEPQRGDPLLAPPHLAAAGAIRPA